MLGRLKNLGITDVFGVPDDYAFPINDAICADKEGYSRLSRAQGEKLHTTGECGRFC